MAQRLCKFLIFFFIFAHVAQAKKFTNQYTEFELPPGWECALEGTEWVCQSNNEERKKEAIIILAAKERGPQDSLGKYQSYLKKTKTFRLPGGKTQVSEPSYTDVTEIQGHRWVDSLHMASEIPGFFTRYLVTVKQKLGVAVTFSVAKDHYDAYKGLFDKIIQSLKVFVPKDYKEGEYVAESSGSAKDLTQGELANDEEIYGINRGGSQQQKSKSSSGDNTLFILLGIGGVIAFVLIKAKKGKKTKKKKKKKKKKKS